ncbi:hypothetical protein Ct9H90mP29_05500 [bacterium]|nr:MAG: hypothetical protein Ct9H90mP29_05500 [bacterium]
MRSFDLWTKVTDIAPERVVRCGKKDNFWEMGETGLVALVLKYIIMLVKI